MSRIKVEFPDDEHLILDSVTWNLAIKLIPTQIADFSEIPWWKS